MYTAFVFVQVEDTLHEKQQDDNKGNDDTEEQSIKQEKEGIEMTDDFEGIEK